LDKDKYHIHQQAYPFVNGDGFHSEIGIVTWDSFRKRNKTENIRTYNIKLTGVRATFVAVEKQYLLHITSVFADFFMYPACAVLCLLCPARLYSIFPHYLINGMILEKYYLI